MNKYAIQSKNYDGSIIVAYFQNQLLEISFSECTMRLRQQKDFIERLPVAHENLETFIKDYGLTLIDTEFKILFGDWWNLYNMKRNKDEADRLFHRLPDEEKVILWFGTKTYNKYCQRNAEWYNKKYPDGFIKEKLYQSEWNTIK